jgi:hypothetical protein
MNEKANPNIWMLAFLILVGLQRQIRSSYTTGEGATDLPDYSPLPMRGRTENPVTSIYYQQALF